MNIRYYTNRGSIWMDFMDQNGKRKRVPSGYPTEALAKANAMVVLAKYLGAATGPSDALAAPSGPAKSTPPKLDGLKLQDAYDKAMRERESWIGSKDKNTLRMNFDQVAAYWGADSSLSKCTREAVLVWREAMLKEQGKRKGTTLSHSTINHRLSMLTTLLEVADLPPHTVKHLSTKGNGRERRITNTEVAKMKDWLLAHAERTGAVAFCNLITVAIECGARQGEVLGLAWGDIGEGTLTFRDTKNGTSRTVPATAAAMRVLEARKGTPTGPFSDLDTDRCTKLWAAARDGIGLSADAQFVFHGLRHECLSRLADDEANAMVIQAIAGHASIVTTQRYVHASLGAMRKAMGMK